MGKEPKRLIKKIIAIIIFVFIILSIIILYSFRMDKSINEKIYTSISKNSSQEAFVINQKISDMFILLNSTSKMVAHYDQINDAEAMKTLKEISSENKFVRMAVTTKDGTSYTTDGVVHDTLDRDYFIKAIKGENAVSELQVSKVDNEAFIAFACPIYKSGEIVGVLRATINTNGLNDIAENANETKDTIIFIVTKTGSILNSTCVKDAIINYFQMLNHATLGKDLYLYQLQKDFENNKSNLIDYNYNKQDLYAYYQPLGINGWYIVTVQSKASLSAEYTELISICLYMFIGLVIVFGAFCFYLFFNQRKIVTKIRISEERYRIVSQQSEDIIFEYNIKDKSIIFSESFNEKFGYEPILDDVPDKTISYGVINSADEKEIRAFFINIETGLINNKASFRMRKGINNYIWCEIMATTIYDNLGKPLKAVGRIRDIDNQIKETEKLIEQARTDCLTGLFNKLTTRNMIETHISSYPTENAAFIYIDIDNFKEINDKFGHEYGDKLIVEITEKIKISFRSNDIIGRIGDDEFVVFLKNVSSEQILNKISELQNILRNSRVKDNLETSISGSIGISLFPSDATDFSGLYKKADLALYKSKSKGKDCFEFYENIED